MNHHAQRPAWAHPNGRLNVEIARDKLVPGPRSALLGGFAERAHQIAFAAAEAQLSAHSKQCGERHALQELPGVDVDSWQASTPLARRARTYAPATRRPTRFRLGFSSKVLTPRRHVSWRETSLESAFDNARAVWKRAISPPNEKMEIQRCNRSCEDCNISNNVLRSQRHQRGAGFSIDAMGGRSVGDLTSISLHATSRLDIRVAGVCPSLWPKAPAHGSRHVLDTRLSSPAPHRSNAPGSIDFSRLWGKDAL